MYTHRLADGFVAGFASATDAAAVFSVLRRLPLKGRVLLVVAYFGASYLTGLLTLFLV